MKLNFFYFIHFSFNLFKIVWDYLFYLQNLGTIRLMIAKGDYQFYDTNYEGFGDTFQSN